MKKLVFCVALVSVSSLVNAEDLSLGITTSYSPAVYKGNDNDVVPFPMIDYRAEHVFVQGVKAGFSVFPHGTPLNIMPHIKYDGRTLDPGDSSNTDIQKLDEREAGFLGGVTFQALTTTGIIEITLGSDISGNHNGVYAESVWKLPYKTSEFLLMPEVGYTWNSDKMNNHYYGVSQAEAAKTSFDAFDPGNAGQLFVGLTHQVELSDTLVLTSRVRYSKLDSKLSDSPIIESDDAISGSIGIAYSF